MKEKYQAIKSDQLDALLKMLMTTEGDVRIKIAELVYG